MEDVPAGIWRQMVNSGCNQVEDEPHRCWNGQVTLVEQRRYEMGAADLNDGRRGARKAISRRHGRQEEAVVAR